MKTHPQSLRIYARNSLNVGDSQQYMGVMQRSQRCNSKDVRLVIKSHG